MLRVNLRKTEHLRVRQLSAQLTLHLVQIFDFLGRESKTFLLVILLQVLDMQNGRRLDVHREDVLIQALVHTLQHRVMLGILALHGEILLDALHTLNRHVLRDFHSVRAPRRNHLTSWTHKKSLQIALAFWLSFTIQPAKLISLISRKLVVHLRGNHTLGWCSEKVNHKVTDLKIFCKDTTFSWNKHTNHCFSVHLCTFFLFSHSIWHKQRPPSPSVLMEGRI